MNESLCYRIYNSLDMNRLVNKLMSATGIITRLDQSIKCNPVLLNFFSNVISEDESIINHAEKYKICLAKNYLNILINSTACTDFSIDFLNSIFEFIFENEVKKGKKIIRDGTLAEVDYRYNIKYTTYVYPSHSDINDSLNEVIDFINAKNKIHPIIKSGILYISLLLIKPFQFGNDIFAKILIPFYLIHCNFISSYYSSIIEETYKKKDLLNEKLKKIYSGNYNDFMCFYLDCLIDSTSKLYDISYEVNNLYIATEKRIDEIFNSNKKMNILIYLFSNMEYTVKGMSECLGVSVMQASRYVDILKENGIIVSNGRQRNAKYIMPDLAAIKKGRT